MLILLPENVQQGHSCSRIETANNDRLTLVIAISYGSRQEIVDATKNIALKVANGQMSIDDINLDTFRQHLYLPDLPDPDLIIRTSGEKDFLIFYFSNLPIANYISLQYYGQILMKMNLKML